MRILFILLTSLLFFIISCCKKEECSTTFTDCIQMEQNENYKTEAFKEGYTIQFPKNYTGKGLIIQEVVDFQKESPDDIQFSYVYLSPVDKAIYFGKILANPIPEKLEISSQTLSENLDLKIEFCIDNEIVAILYYNININAGSNGKLYIQHNDWFYEGLTIKFQNECQLEEIISVIKTIVKK